MSTKLLLASPRATYCRDVVLFNKQHGCRTYRPILLLRLILLLLALRTSRSLFNEISKNLSEDHINLKKNFEYDLKSMGLTGGQSDFTSEWVPMNESEALNYYTPYEICRLKGFTAGCEKSVSGKRKTEPDACGAYGNGFVHSNAPCSNHHIGAFFRHKLVPLKSVDYVGDIIKTLISKGIHDLILIGDSITSHSFNDVYCSLERRGHNVEKWTNLSLWGFKRPTLFFELHHPENSSFTYPRIQSADGTRHDIIFRTTHYTISKTRDDFDLYQNQWLSGLQRLVSNRTVCFIINIGLHYNNLNHYYNDLTELLYFADSVLAKRHGHIVFFRETSAQHFPTQSGQYLDDPRQYYSNISRVQSGLTSSLRDNFSGTGAKTTTAIINESTSFGEKSFTCQPITNERMRAQSVKNRILHRIIGNFSNIAVIPYFRITLGRHDFHVANYQDCSHFCFGPMMWLPFWKIVMEKISERLA